MNQKPFIKIFVSEDGRKYIYCPNTNRIIKAQEIVYDIIEHFHVFDAESIHNVMRQKYSIPEIQKALNELEMYHKKTNFANNKSPQRLELKATMEEYHYKLYNGIKGLTINVTNNCNMACKYCLYGKPFYNKRKATSLNMSEETARNTIDFLIKYSRDSAIRILGFYGGEPFLNYDLMKSIVSYFQQLNKKHGNKKLHIHVTSNCTLLDDDRCRWLIDNDISLFASLDGPEIIHDRYRRFKNGIDTYKTVYTNLNKLMDMDCDYYQNRVKFNVVLAPPVHFEQLYEFLLNGKLVTNKFRISELVFDNNGYFQNIAESSKNTYTDYEYKVLNKYFAYKEQDAEKLREIEILEKMHSLLINNYIYRGTYQASETILMNPVCEIGVNRLFVINDGSLFPCERIEQFKSFEFGNVRNGYYLSNEFGTRAWELIIGFNQFLDNLCCSCWVYRFCSQRTCYKFASSPSGFSKERLLDNCNRMKERCLRNLKKLMHFDELYPNVLDKIGREYSEKRKMH